MKRVFYLLTIMLIMSNVGYAQDPVGDSYTVYWSVNGEIISEQSVEAGGFIDMTPEAPMPMACANYGYTFVGWTDAPISGSQGWEPSPMYISAYEYPSVSQDVTYYAVFRSDATAGGGTYEMTDVLTREMTGVASGSTNYTDWSGIMASSSATYAGNTAGGNDAIQMRSSGNSSGIITTATGGTVTMISVEWNSKTTDGQTLNVYGSYTPFSSVSELYSGSGTQIGTIVKGSNSVLSISGYEYIGMRSSSGALYLNSISITWMTQGAGGTTEYVTSCGSTPTGGDATSGTLENGQSWSLEDGRLSITGAGNIAGFASANDVPWYSHRNEITSLFLGADFSSIGGFVFYDLDNLTSISCPSSYMPTLEGNTFNPSKLSQITATVRANLLSQYQADPYWSQMTLDTYPDSGGDTGEISGNVGDLTWMLVDGELIIEGTGEIPDFDDDEGLPWVAYKNQINTIKLNGDVSSIGMYAFAGLTNLSTLNASSTLQYIGAYAFENCLALTTINLPVNEVVAADADAFSGCLTSNITVYVPEELLNDFTGTEVWGSMNVVGNGSSGGEDKLLDSGDCGSSVYWEIYESGLMNIKGSGTMYYWPEYQNIPWNAYRSQITSVQVQEGVESLTTAAFFDCVQLTSVTLPASLCCIDDSTFYNCVALRSIACGREYPPSVNGTYPFYNVNLSEITLTIPEASESMYSAAEYWGQMKIVAQGSSTSQLEPYQLEYIFVNSIGIDGFDPGKYEYDIVLPAGSETPHLSYMAGNVNQDVEIEQPTSPNSTGYLHVSVDGVKQATYTIHFTCESSIVTITLSNAWQFIMLPSSAFAVNYEDITTNGDVVWATYDGERRAGGQSGWKTVELAQSYYEAWGHIVRAVNDSAMLSLDLKGSVNNQEANLELLHHSASHAENANWNFIGNPYNAGYDINGLLAAGIESPITVWNGTGYSTYTPGIDEYKLQPFEPFFIQLPDSQTTTIKLLPEYIDASMSLPTGNGGNTGDGGNGSDPTGGNEGSYTYTFLTKAWDANEGSWMSGMNGYDFSNGRGVQCTTSTSGANAQCPITYSNISTVIVTYCTNSNSAGAGTMMIEINGFNQTQEVTQTGGTELREMVFDFVDSMPSGAPSIMVNCTQNSIYIYSVTIITK